jgi:hypothetical protein
LSIETITDSQSHPAAYHSISPQVPDFPYWCENLAFGMAALIFGTGSYFLSFIIFGAILCYMRITSTEVSSTFGIMSPVRLSSLIMHRAETIVSQTMETLDELITAGNVWGSIIHDAITLLEDDERK